jgi:hypothetical protein
MHCRSQPSSHAQPYSTNHRFPQQKGMATTLL